MNKSLKYTPPRLDTSQATAFARKLFAPADLQRNIFAGALLLSLLAAFYWLLIASDRYVSEAHIIIQRTDA